MRHLAKSLLIVFFFSCALGTPAIAWAQVDDLGISSGWGGSGFYFSFIKLALFYVPFLCWVATADWVNVDAAKLDLGQEKWNMLTFFVFVVGFSAAWWIPIFFAGYPIVWVAYLVPTLLYVRVRNKIVPEHEKVLTADHLRHVWAGIAKRFGMKVEAERKDQRDAGPVKLTSTSGEDDRANRALLISARQTESFVETQRLLLEGLDRNADGVMLDYTRDAMQVKILLDGVWHSGETWPREEGDGVQVTLKVLCGLNPEDRRSRQEGTFIAALSKKEKYSVRMVSQGTKTGERVLLHIFSQETPYETLEDLGMRPQMQEDIKATIAQPQGFFIISAPPANGLRTTSNVLFRALDRFTREFMSIEDAQNRYEEVENIPVSCFDSGAGETPKEVLRDIFLREPQVVVARDLFNAEFLESLLKEIDNDRMIITTQRARDCAEALNNVLAVGAPPSLVASNVTGVVCQRLVRRLCDECKEAFTPSPKLLSQLGLPPGRVKTLYRPPQPDEEGKAPPSCYACDDIRYAGRIAFFEFLRVDDQVRKTLAAKPSVDVIRQAAVRSGMRPLAQEGLLLVAKGITSAQEWMRVMKSV